MVELLRTVFENLEQARIDYCLLRDYDQLCQLLEGGGRSGQSEMPSGVQTEIDLLARPDQLKALSSLLSRLGFVKLPGWGHAPHHFFVAYDPQADGWLKLDVVTEVVYGRPIQALKTPLASNCLANRRRHGLTFIPAPEDELVTTLLHCALDKGYFAQTRRERLQTLRQQVTDEAYLSALLISSWLPTMTWPRLAGLIEARSWEALLADREAVAARLTGHDRWGVAGRRARSRVLRKLNAWFNARRPQSLTVALLAPDGAGKSTLAAGIEQSFYFPVRLIYMGLYQTPQGSKMPSGVRLRTGTSSRGVPMPGLGLAGRLARQWGRYLTGRYHQARRRLVIFDRYTYDSLLPASQPLNRFKRWRRWLLAHACPGPDLVLLLDAPGKVLYARKGEHTITRLESERQAYLQLRAHVPQMVVIDAQHGAESVRRQAISTLWRGYLARQAGVKITQVMGEASGKTQGNWGEQVAGSK